MGNLIFIDSDDIGELSDALRKALEKRGIVFCGNEEIPSDTDVFVDDAPMPSGCGTTEGYSWCGSITYDSSCGNTIPHNSCGYDGFSGHCGGWCGSTYPRSSCGYSGC